MWRVTLIFHTVDSKSIVIDALCQPLFSLINLLFKVILSTAPPNLHN